MLDLNVHIRFPRTGIKLLQFVLFKNIKIIIIWVDFQTEIYLILKLKNILRSN